INTAGFDGLPPAPDMLSWTATTKTTNRPREFARMFDRHYAAWPDLVPHFLELPASSLYSNLAVSALRCPTQSAIIYYGTSLTYAELERQAEALAGYLQHAGVKAGDRVLLYMQNSPQFVIGFYAILRANAVVVPVNPMNRKAELEYLITD